MPEAGHLGDLLRIWVQHGVVTYSLPNLTLHHLNNSMMRRHITGKLGLVAPQKQVATTTTGEEPTTGPASPGRIAH